MFQRMPEERRAKASGSKCVVVITTTTTNATHDNYNGQKSICDIEYKSEGNRKNSPNTYTLIVSAERYVEK